MNLKIIKELLKKYKARPSKRLGQNFLIDKSVLQKIIETADLKSSDFILEIGPGIGNLTQELAKKAKKVIAVEKDLKLAEILKELLDCWNIKNVRIVNKDILKLDPKPSTLKSYKIVANLPYYIVSPVIRKFLESKYPPESMILMVQKEVAQRICARPPEMSLLAVSVQFYAQPEIISYVSKKSFWPQPKVDGAVIKLKVESQKLKVNKELFFGIVKAGFIQPRKQLINNLSQLGQKEKIKIWLLKNNIQPSQRAETLSVKDWIRLTKTSKRYLAD